MALSYRSRAHSDHKLSYLELNIIFKGRVRGFFVYFRSYQQRNLDFQQDSNSD